MPYSKQAQQDIARAVRTHGIEKAAAVLGLKLNTVERVTRLLKESARENAAPADNRVRILGLDIETSPMLAHIWRPDERWVPPDRIVEDSRILCWAAKWVGSDGVLTCREEGTGWRDDRRVAEELAALMGKADIVVAHNGKAFDISTVWARLAYHNIPPPEPFKIVDTLRIAREAFRFPHNSLAGLARYLKLGAKLEHEGFPMWERCMEGDEVSWEKMTAYNVQDVVLLEEVYLRLRAYDRRHPNLALYYDDGLLRCVRCGLPELKAGVKPWPIIAGEYAMYQCQSCGAWCRSGERVKRDTPVNRSIV